MKGYKLGFLLFSLMGFIGLESTNQEAYAEAYASPERAAAAVGHYARARAMMVEALAEFDQAARIANPDLLIDSEEWRLSVISRTEELNRVLDPKPRVSRQGVRFRASGIHVQHERTKVPRPEPDPYTVNFAGEERYLEEQKSKKAREVSGQAQQGNTPLAEELPSATVDPAVDSPSVDLSLEPITPKKPAKMLGQALKQDDPEKIAAEKDLKEATSQIEVAPVVAEVPKDENSRASNFESEKNSNPKDESEVSKAIEAVIKDRLKQLEKERQSKLENSIGSQG